jgi:hypothetical protein
LTITVGARPLNANNRVDVYYRIHGKPPVKIHAVQVRTDVRTKSQYFSARLPTFQIGDVVEYGAVCTCSGKQVPSPAPPHVFPSSFRVVASSGHPVASRVVASSGHPVASHAAPGGAGSASAVPAAPQRAAGSSAGAIAPTRDGASKADLLALLAASNRTIADVKAHDPGLLATIQGLAAGVPHGQDDPAAADPLANQDALVRDLAWLHEPLEHAKVHAVGDIVHLDAAAVTPVIAQASSVAGIDDAVLAQLVAAATLTDAQARDLGLAAGLFRLFDEHQELAAAVMNARNIAGGKLTDLRDLCALDARGWQGFLETAKIAPPPGSSLEAYAQALARRIAELYPHEAFLRRLPGADRNAIVDSARALEPLVAHEGPVLGRSLEEVSFEGFDAAQIAVIETAYDHLKELASKYPGMEIEAVIDDPKLSPEAKADTIVQRIGHLGNVLARNPDESLLSLDYAHDGDGVAQLGLHAHGMSDDDQHRVVSTLKAHQRLHALTGDVEHSHALLAAGITSATHAATMRFEDFKAATGLDHATALRHHQKAKATLGRTTAAAAAIMDVMHGGFDRLRVANVGSDVKDSLRKLDGFSELFGSQDYCQCEHCSSILSPAAYFVDLMAFVDTHVRKRYFKHPGHSLDLKTRRPDLWTLPLSCDNTNTLVPTLEIANEVLVHHIAKVGLKSTLTDRAAIELLVFDKLASTHGSFHQPFVLSLERLGAYLDFFGQRRADIARAVGASPDQVTWAELGIGLLEHTIITQPDHDLKTLGKLYGTTLHPHAAINAKDLLHAMNLSRDDLGALVATHFVTAGLSTRPHLVTAKSSPASVQNDVELLHGATHEALDRMHRFTRLWRHLPWSIRELDLVLTHLQHGSQDAGELDLARVVEVRQAQDRLGGSVEEVCALWSDIPTRAVAPDTQPLSLVDRLFNGDVAHGHAAHGHAAHGHAARGHAHAGAQPIARGAHARAPHQHPPVTRRLSATAIAHAQKPLPDHTVSFLHPSLRLPDSTSAEDPQLARLLAGLRVSDEDLIRLITCLQTSLGADIHAATEAGRSIVLRTTNLALLYRHARLAERLGLSIPELFQLLGFLPSLAGGAVHTLADLTAVLDLHAWWKTTAYSLDELCVALGKLPLAADAAPDPGALAAQLIASSSGGSTFADTVFVQPLGVTDLASRQILQAIAASVIQDGAMVRLVDDFDPDRTLSIPADLGVQEAAVRKVLRDYHPVAIVPLRLSTTLGLAVDKISKLIEMTKISLVGPATTKALRVDVSKVTTARGLPDAQPLIDLVAALAPLTVLFKAAAFDAEALGFVSAHLGAFGLDRLPPARIDGVRTLSVYTRLAGDPAAMQFAGAAPPVDPADLRKALGDHDSAKGFPAGDDAVLARLLNTAPGTIASMRSALPPSPHAAAALDRLARCVELSRFLGVGGQALVHAAADDHTELTQAADALLGAFRAKCADDAEFHTKLGPYEDKLLARKRDALTDYLMHSTEPRFESRRAIYEYFLIDVDLEGCSRTSRVVSATNSVQLYVQRCLMNLEQESEHKAHGHGHPATASHERHPAHATHAPHSAPATHGPHAAAAHEPHPATAHAQHPATAAHGAPAAHGSHPATAGHEHHPAAAGHGQHPPTAAHAHHPVTHPHRAPHKAAPTRLHVTLDKEAMEEWEWRKAYRMWEANRKVFLYPENYLEPDLRDDQTPLFKAFASELLQKQIDDQAVLDAYSSYLSGFEEVAKLKIAGAYNDVQTAHHGQAADSVLHLIGVAHTDPPTFYHRTRESAGHSYTWSPWQPISVQIPVRRVSPVVHDGRLHLFWIEIRTQSTNKVKDAGSTFIGYRHKLTLKYTTLRLDGKWTAPQDVALPREAPFDSYTAGLVTDYFPEDKDGKPTSPVPPLDIQKRKHAEPIDDYTLVGPSWESAYIESKGPSLSLVARDFHLTAQIDLFARTMGKLGKTRVNSKGVGHAFPMVLSEKHEVYACSQKPWFSHQTAFSNLMLDDQRLPIFLPDIDAKSIKELLVDVTQTVALAMARQQWKKRKIATLKHGAALLLAVPGSPEDVLVHSGVDTLLLHHEDHNAKHPYSLWRIGTTLADTIARDLFVGGVDRLLDLQTQHSLKEHAPALDLVGHEVLDETGHGKLDFKGSYGVYYREIFFHIPFLIADHLNSQGQFAAAQRWYHYIFNPAADGEGPDRAWRYREFRELSPESMHAAMTDEAAIKAYEEDPFNPDAIARLRLSAYQKSVVMKYIDNLLDWGDSLFSEFTMESVSEATMLYSMAADLLGERPYQAGTCGGSSHAMSYAQISRSSGKSSTFLAGLESYVAGKRSAGRGQKPAAGHEAAHGHPATQGHQAAHGHPAAQGHQAAHGHQAAQGHKAASHSQHHEKVSHVVRKSSPLAHATAAHESTEETRPSGKFVGTGWKRTSTGGWTSGHGARSGGGTKGVQRIVGHGPSIASRATAPSLGSSIAQQVGTIFCVPPNTEFFGYWNRVEDRLYKIHNCLDITGERRDLALFAPEIDPRMLMKVKAAGLTLDEVMAATSGDLPPYRFVYLIEKAKSFASTLQSFGSALLSALEKKDGEALAKLRVVHEQHIAKLSTQLKQWEIDAADASLTAANRQKEAAEFRQDHYQGLIDTDLTAWERIEQLARHTASTVYITESIIQGLGSIAALVPQLGSPFAMKYGGVELSGSLSGFASGINAVAKGAEAVAASTSIEATFDRRREDWKFQRDLAAREVAQLERQAKAAEIRKEIAERSLEVHQKTIEQTEEVYTFYGDKFTSFGLYTWMAATLQRSYRQAYMNALAIAHMCETAFKFERDDDSSLGLTGGYWDGSHAGLLAGDQLLLDLQALERRFIETNYRTMEIEQSFPLTQLDPKALVKLRETGTCTFTIPEVFFDLAYPGHYRRRIKAVRLTIPCVTGPYTNVGATLTLNGSKVRVNANDASLKTVPPQRTVSIATSKAQNDAGVFELGFHDERYMPFEGAGTVESQWTLELPASFRPFDYQTISDVVLTINYTALDSQQLRKSVSGQLAQVEKAIIDALGTTPIGRIFSMRQEFPVAYKALLASPLGTAVTFEIQDWHFPAFVSAQGRAMKVSKAMLALKTSTGMKLDGVQFVVHGEQVQGFAPADELGGLPAKRLAGTLSKAVTGAHTIAVAAAGVLGPAPSSGTVQIALDGGKIVDVLLYVEYTVTTASS